MPPRASLRTRSLVVAASLALAPVAPRANAQPSDPVPAVRRRIDAELRCVQGAEADLTQWARLLANAKRQLESATDPSARADAANAVLVLEGHVRETAEALLACMPEAEPEPSPVVEAPAPPARAPLTPISEHLRAAPPVETGRGHIDAADVHRALRPFGAAVDACYEALAERHAIVRGFAELVVDVRPDGTRAHVEIRSLDFGDATFRRCVTQASNRVEGMIRPRGGPTILNVRIQLGPED